MVHSQLLSANNRPAAEYLRVHSDPLQEDLIIFELASSPSLQAQPDSNLSLFGSLTITASSKLPYSIILHVCRTLAKPTKAPL
jgi:hypothetical protein